MKPMNFENPKNAKNGSKFMCRELQFFHILREFDRILGFLFICDLRIDAQNHSFIRVSHPPLEGFERHAGNEVSLFMDALRINVE